ncbi:hypothetical protein DICVIV_04857 [Dictyocaulus viviparus]|uniref:Uncharacterized protein n=1 Tax=Dictyocaulus viviparus TaxID=29172 RepID=A0A0D8XZ26_DICVI|nr:hypothetical protein DICVIV_04857 [Dictyocaulus viviparus]
MVNETGFSFEIPWESHNVNQDDVYINENVFDWSNEIFPDEESASVGEKRPLDILDDFSLKPKRKAVLKESDAHMEQTDDQSLFTAPIQLRSCLKPVKPLLTDFDENICAVNERILWHKKFESHSAKKKRVRFRVSSVRNRTAPGQDRIKTRTSEESTASYYKNAGSTLHTLPVRLQSSKSMEN